MNEDLKKMDIAIIRSNIRGAKEVYSIVQPAEKAIKASCERLKHMTDQQKAQKYYKSDIQPQIQHFIAALNVYTDTSNRNVLHQNMMKIYQNIQQFNASINYLVQKNLVQVETPDTPPKNSHAPEKTAPETPAPVSSTHQQNKTPRPALPKPKTLNEKYFDPSAPDPEKSETLFNKKIEVILQITAEDPDTQKRIFQYYLANPNDFQRKTEYRNFWEWLFRKNKKIIYRQKFRFSDWKPLFPEKTISEETLELSKNIFGIPEGSNLTDDGLILTLSQNALKISFKTYGERSSKSLKSEFSGQEQPKIELSRKDFSGNDNFSCHYEDTLCFYHTFQQVHSETWNEKECLVRLKLDLKLK